MFQKRLKSLKKVFCDGGDNMVSKEDKKDELYCVELIDYSCPSASSGTRRYVGTLNKIKEVLECIDEDCGKSEYLKAYEDFVNGGTGEMKVYYGTVRPLIMPVILKIKLHGFMKPFKYTFMNVWDCPYYMSADSVVYTLYYVKMGKSYCRYVGLTFKNLAYSCNEFKDKLKNTGKFTEEYKKEMLSALPDKEFLNEAYGYWGHPGIIYDVEKDVVGNRLFFCDKRFKSYKDALEDYKNPKDINYDGFFFDIFGDG